MNLPKKQILFCKEYVIDFNGTQAAIRAGYSKKTANEQASRLLTNVSISEYVNELSQKRKQDLSDRYDISLENIQKQYHRFVFQDIRNYYNEDGTLKNVHDLDDDSAAALAGIEVDEIFEFVDGQKFSTGFTKKIRRWDAPKALEGLVKLMGYAAVQKSEVTLMQPMNDEQVDKIIATLRENKAK